MPEIRENTVEDVLAQLPEWEPIGRTLDGDVFIAAVGFEERSSLSFRTWCNDPNGRGSYAILILYPFNQIDNEKQLAFFRLAAENANVKIVSIMYDRLSIYGQLLNTIESLVDIRNAIVDISSMASFVIYPVMRAICDNKKRLSANICYTEASGYFPSKEEWERFREEMKSLDLLERARLYDESHFQSKGIDNVYESMHFQGRNIDNLPVKLAIVPNFSFERVNRMIDFATEQYGASRHNCEWIIGVPLNDKKDGWRHDAVWEIFNKPDHKHEASTLRYKEILLTLHRIWSLGRNQTSLLVAPVGSKAQHFGILIFLLMHPEVGLILSEPKEFTAARYSTGSGNQWQLLLGSITEFKAQICAWNQIIFNWE